MQKAKLLKRVKTLKMVKNFIKILFNVRLAQFKRVSIF